MGLCLTKPKVECPYCEETRLFLTECDCSALPIMPLVSLHRRRTFEYERFICSRRVMVNRVYRDEMRARSLTSAARGGSGDA